MPKIDDFIVLMSQTFATSFMYKKLLDTMLSDRLQREKQKTNWIMSADLLSSIDHGLSGYLEKEKETQHTNWSLLQDVTAKIHYLYYRYVKEHSIYAIAAASCWATRSLWKTANDKTPLFVSDYILSKKGLFPAGALCDDEFKSALESADSGNGTHLADFILLKSSQSMNKYIGLIGPKPQRV
jgi:hypothetical protein